MGETVKNDEVVKAKNLPLRRGDAERNILKLKSFSLCLCVSAVNKMTFYETIKNYCGMWNVECGIIKFILSTFILLLSFSSFAMSAEGSKQPINVTSDSMEAETSTNKVIFKGNVVARQKDITITSNELMATYADNGKELKEVLATGNVRVTQQDKIAVADNALFMNTDRKIILTGNPKVWQGKDVVSGDKIIYFLDEDRTIVEGGQKRVRATIHPKKEEAFANPTGKGTH